MRHNPGYLANSAQRAVITVLTVNTKGRMVEGVLRDGGKIMVGINEISSSFRWPKTGETWAVERCGIQWKLGGRVRIEHDRDIEEMQEGELRLDAEVITDSEGRQLLTAETMPPLPPSWPDTTGFPDGSFLVVDSSAEEGVSWHTPVSLTDLLFTVTGTIIEDFEDTDYEFAFTVGGTLAAGFGRQTSATGHAPHTGLGCYGIQPSSLNTATLDWTFVVPSGKQAVISCWIRPESTSSGNSVQVAIDGVQFGTTVAAGVSVPYTEQVSGAIASGTHTFTFSAQRTNVAAFWGLIDDFAITLTDV